MASDAQKNAAKKYLNEKVDEIKVRVPKGYKAEITNHAKTNGESVNEFINRAIKETIDKDTNNITNT